MVYIHATLAIVIYDEVKAFKYFFIVTFIIVKKTKNNNFFIRVTK